MQLGQQLLGLWCHDLLVAIVVSDTFECLFCGIENLCVVNVRTVVHELFDQETMTGQRLVFESSERHLRQNTSQVILTDRIVVKVVVSNFGQSTKCTFSADDSLLIECVITLNELFALRDSLLENIELAIGQ